MTVALPARARSAPPPAENCQDDPMRTTVAMSRWPLPGLFAALGAAAAGGIGLVVGGVVGLFVYAPTALFAAVEVGIPSALLGGIVGAAVGVIGMLRRRAVRSRGRSA